jgi:hypothetical protein
VALKGKKPLPRGNAGKERHLDGYRNIVVSDACTAPDLQNGDTVVPGAAVHAASLAALDGSSRP